MLAGDFKMKKVYEIATFDFMDVAEEGIIITSTGGSIDDAGGNDSGGNGGGSDSGSGGSGGGFNTPIDPF